MMEMATPLPEGWWERERIPKVEKIWIILSIVLVVVLFSIWMPIWHVLGTQNSVGEVYRISPDTFKKKLETFITENKVGEENGIPIVKPTPEGDVYISAQRFTFYPILRLKAGERYKLHISALDVQHGFSIVGPKGEERLFMQWTIQLYPGYEYILEFQPTKPGTYYIICNEYCGEGHHTMVQKLIVE